MGICTMEWMTEEEAKAFESEGDPKEASHSPYKIQPDYLEKICVDNLASQSWKVYLCTALK